MEPETPCKTLGADICTAAIFQPSGVWMQAALILAFKVKSGPEETGLIIVKSAIKTASSWDTDVSQELVNSGR